MFLETRRSEARPGTENWERGGGLGEGKPGNSQSLLALRREETSWSSPSGILP